MRPSDRVILRVWRELEGLYGNVRYATGDEAMYARAVSRRCGITPERALEVWDVRPAPEVGEIARVLALQCRRNEARAHARAS